MLLNRNFVNQLTQFTNKNFFIMKKIFFGSAMLAVLALVGCKKEQSQFTLDNIEQKATISGTVVYQSNLVGQSTEEVALAGVRVVASVDFSEYSSNAEGVKQFEATTDSAGQFSIVIPTGAKEIPVQLHIDVVKTTQSGKNIYLSEYKKSWTVKANEAKVEKIILAKDEALSECVAEGTLKGKLIYDAGTVSKEDGTKEEGKVAAAGVNVTAEVAYENAGVSKKFVAKTDANGEFTFSIPVEKDGCAVVVSIEQFKGTYTEFKNNQWVSVEALYSMSATVTASVKGGEITPVKLVADVRDISDETTKSQVAFKVKGKFLQVVEKAKYNSTGENRIGTEAGTKASTYPFTVELRRTDPTTSEVTYIRYEGNQANESGVYEVEVKLYDSWNVATDHIRVYVYADNSVVVNDFAHYYFAWDEDSDKFLYDPDNDYKTQRLTGLYKGGSNNVVAEAVVTEKQIYFDLSMPDATLAFEPEDENAVYGVGSTSYVDGWEYATAAMIKPSSLATAFQGYYSPVNFGQKDGADRLIYAGGIKVW